MYPLPHEHQDDRDPVDPLEELLDTLDESFCSEIVELPANFQRAFRFERTDTVDVLVRVVAAELRLPRPDEPERLYGWDRQYGAWSWADDTVLVRILLMSVAALDRLAAPLPPEDASNLGYRIMNRIDDEDVLALTYRLGLSGRPFKRPPRTLGSTLEALRGELARILNDRLQRAAASPPANRSSSTSRTRRRRRRPSTA